MSTPARREAQRRSCEARKQAGFGGILLLVLIAGIAASAALFTFSKSNSLAINTERRTADVLASAKAALIVYAVAIGTKRPGELPCPDTNGDWYARPALSRQYRCAGQISVEDTGYSGAAGQRGRNVVVRRCRNFSPRRD